MDIFLPTLPFIALLVSLLLKRGAIVSCVVGSLAVLMLVVVDDRYTLNLKSLLASDLPVVLILTLSVALVIVPGQILNALLQQSGVIAAIGARIKSLPLPRVTLAATIVLGLAPMLEAMTGFGVSLFFTVPVLAQLFSIRKALLLALLGMNIMPWGTLALATVVGSQIAGLPFDELSAMTACASFAVFPATGLLVFIICRQPDSPWHAGLAASIGPLAAGLILSTALVFYTAHTAELAGVVAGFTTAVIILLARWLRSGVGWSLRPPALLGLLKLFAPYLLLIGLIGLSRIAPVYQTLQGFGELQSGTVTLFIFTSPGVFLFLTVVLLCALSKTIRDRTKGGEIFSGGLRRSAHPVLGIMLFVMFAQLHRASGIFDAIIARMVHLDLAQLTFIAPLLGMISGYTTGSNVGGNALAMSLQVETGAHFGKQLAFAALQNSAAGHAVFMSLPIILLALSIAAAGDKTGDADAHQTWLIRRALLCAPLIYAALVIPFYFLTG